MTPVHDYALMSAFEPEKIATYVKTEGAYRWYEVSPSVLYPRSLFDLVRGGTITEEDALLAVTPRDSVTIQEAVDRRKAVQERARQHFLLTLIERTGPGVALQITNEPEWRH